nr:SDR family NAD(P)-dependent oxidoreductase [Mycolicibacterium malmesburyense]CRL71276.1 short-chain dehydrogenase/reductase SDR [Mycolicibacterium malmesburyense]
MLDNHFRGQVCVVTGAASGIGLAVGEALLEHGAVVVLADLDPDRLTAVAQRLSAHVGRVHSAAVDLAAQRRAALASGDAEAVFRTARDGR